MSFLLSISIPTRDRLDSIKTNIEYLITQIQLYKLEKLVEIVISDNSNKKNDFLSELNKSLSFLKYIYSDDLGHDYNIQSLVSNSSGKYIWFCQDHTKILFDDIFILIEKLNSQNPKYVFLSTKNNYKTNHIINNDNRYISFKNTYLNTNLVKRKLFIEYYNKLLPKFDGSHLVFQHAIIYLNFYHSEDEILIFKKKFSEYKYFVRESYNKNTWSRSLKSYLLILEKSVLMFRDIKKIPSLDFKKIKSIYSKHSHGFALIYQLSILQKRDQNFNFSKSYIKLISEHYTFNKVTKLYLKVVLSEKKIFNKFALFYFIELSYLLFSPLSFLVRLKNKFINSLP